MYVFYFLILMLFQTNKVLKKSEKQNLQNFSLCFYFFLKHVLWDKLLLSRTK